MDKTLKQYNKALAECEETFSKKTQDYGTSWRVFRPSSLTDQIFIKAQRIRTLQKEGVSKVGEGIYDEFLGIVNYSAMALIQMELGYSGQSDMNAEEALKHYRKWITSTKELMIKKNHDYGEAWRDMRVSSITDLILVKLLRIKQIEDNNGATIASEGADGNYQDMMNYALFCMIKMREEEGNL